MALKFPALVAAFVAWQWQWVCANFGFNFFSIVVSFFVVRELWPVVLPTKRKDVRGQTVLITGGGGDLGQLFAERFLRLGCIVVIWDLTDAITQKAVTKLRAAGKDRKVYGYSCDISDREAVYATAKQVSKDVGDVDILVNNAGIMPAKDFFDLRDEVIEKTMAVNMNAHFWTVKAFAPAMMKRNSGHIVSVASSAGFIGVTKLTEYGASKAAAAHFARSLRNDFRTRGCPGVKITCVCPYAVDTQLAKGWDQQSSIGARIASLLGASLQDADHVADRLVDATLCNEDLVFIPHGLMKTCIFLSFALPHWLQEHVSVFLGLDSFLNKFEGVGKALH